MCRIADLFKCLEHVPALLNWDLPDGIAVEMSPDFDVCFLLIYLFICARTYEIAARCNTKMQLKSSSSAGAAASAALTRLGEARVPMKLRIQLVTSLTSPLCTQHVA